MTILSNTEAALLGLLAEQPMYPYQIEQQVRYRDMRSWTELSMSAIYKILIKLEERDLIERTDCISSENRLRKLYTIKERGRKLLKKKIETLLSDPVYVRWPVDIGVYNCDLLSENEIINAFGSYREALAQKIKEYEGLIDFLKKSGCPKHRQGVATRPIFLLRAEIAWVDFYLQELTAQESEPLK